MTAETLLALGLIAVYLFDSMHFLRIGEAVVVTRRAHLLGLSFGSGFEFGGRRPFLPNPLTPFWPELRLDWVNVAGDEGRVRGCSAEMLERAAALRWVGVFSGACTAAIVIGAPAALLAGEQLMFIGCVAVCLICELTAAGLLLRARKRLGLGFAQWLSLALPHAAVRMRPGTVFNLVLGPGAQGGRHAPRECLCCLRVYSPASPNVDTLHGHASLQAVSCCKIAPMPDLSDPVTPVRPGEGGVPFEVTSTDAYVASTDVSCWKCKRDIEVICVYCESGVDVEEPLTSFTVSTIWAMDEALTYQLQPWPHFKRGLGPSLHAGYFANHCPHCNARQDDMDLHDNPEDPFFSIPHALPGTLRLTPLVGQIQLSGCCHFSI